MMQYMGWAGQVLEIMALIFVLVIGVVTFATVAMYIVDKLQKEDAVRRNYPVIGRFRHLFTSLGEFFRQYFFAMDREELPFNRAQRDWIERASKGSSNTIAFGSTRNLSVVGTPIFVNAAFPPLDSQVTKTEPMLIGPFARTPYNAPSIFNISAMSFGALSKPAVQALSRGAAKAGIWMNTGEGGVSPFHLESGCDIVFQIGTAHYGVRAEDGSLSDEKLRKVAEYPQIKMFEIKMAQGAKPGKGGILPASKVTREIAEIRGIPVGQASISPNRHTSINNWEQLLDYVERVREVSGKPTGFKTVVGSPDDFDVLFRLISERGLERAPDFITIDGGEGGTGAAPMPLIDLVGMTVREALPKVSALRDFYGLGDRIRIIASAKLVNPGDVAWALAAGADFVTSARGFMFSLGCIQALKCNKNTCPTGITTHDPHLQHGLVPEEKYKKVAQYAEGLVHEVETIAHSVGVSEPRQIQRSHVRLVMSDGSSKRMSRIYPNEAEHTRAKEI